MEFAEALAIAGKAIGAGLCMGDSFRALRI